MGTKEVLFKTRSLGWGTETGVYHSPQDQGVWRVDLVDAPGGADSSPISDARVRVQQAQPVDAPVEEWTLARFVERLGEYFACPVRWSSSHINPDWLTG